VSKTDDILADGTVAERAALFASWPDVTDGDFWPSAYYEIAHLNPIADRLATRPLWGWQAYANAAAIRTITQGEAS
jgi:hypothetical protein